MNAPLPNTLQFDVAGLAQAIAASESNDSFHSKLSASQWQILGSFIQPFACMKGQLVIEQGAKDSSVYFVESGMLSVHFKDRKDVVKLAMLGAGAVVGEGAFFSHQPRSATVQAISDCKLWCLTPTRFIELSNRQSAIALELSMGLGGVLAKRLAIRPKRIAIT
ncbi:MAG: cyclic nucleotide-binding domain-containing protein [Burkholderiaceae bacterium]